MAPFRRGHRPPWPALALLASAAAVAPAAGPEAAPLPAEAKVPEPRQGEAPYDCEANHSDWQSAWPLRKKAWCCDHAKRGCPPALAAYDCEAGGEREWTEERKAWCCRRAGRGCPAAAPGAAAAERRLLAPCEVACGYGGKSFTCAERVRYTAAHDFQGHAGSCESAFGSVLTQCGVCASCPLSETGCSAPRPPPLAAPAPASPPPALPTPAPVLAPAPVPAPRPLTAAEGAAACQRVCSYEGKSASCSFRIRWGASHRYRDQSLACKKAWIMVATECSECTLCPLEQAGCVEQHPALRLPAPSPTPRPFDCLPDETNRVAGWSDDKREWCCNHRGHGCAAGEDLGARSVPYDCLAGFANWRKGWSDEKMRWCCEHRQRGCLEQRTKKPETYACTGTPGEWPEEEQAWCCEHRSLGCPTTTTTPVPFDCLAGYAKWEVGWSTAKIHWCCRHRGKGCPPARSTTTEPYDCTAGESNWKLGWSDAKKKWCCEHKEAHCPQRHFDCHAELSEWRQRWSPEKKEWCCQHEEVHCDDSPYDCSGGFPEAWPREQRDWCCQHKQKGCQRPGEPEGKFEARPVPAFRLRSGAWSWIALPSLCAAAVAGLSAAALRPLQRRFTARDVRSTAAFEPLAVARE